MVKGGMEKKIHAIINEWVRQRRFSNKTNNK